MRLKPIRGREAPSSGLVKSFRRQAIRYFIIAFLIILTVIMYVWQNIEVTKKNLDYRKELRIEKRLIKEVDKLRYRIEQYKTIDAMEEYARSQGLKKITPSDVDVVEIKENESKK